MQKVLFDAVLHEWRRNYGSTRNPDYRPCCTYVRKFIRGKLYSNYDLHYVSPGLTKEGCSDVAFYVTKYMMKPSKREVRLQQALHLNLPEYEYESVWSLVRSRTFASLGLGVNGEKTPFGIEPDPKIVEYIRKCVEISKSSEQFAKFYTPQTGSSFPLSRYYKSKFYCYNIKDEEVFFNRQDRIDGVLITDKSETSIDVCLDKHKKRCFIADLHDQSGILDEFYE